MSPLHATRRFRPAMVAAFAIVLVLVGGAASVATATTAHAADGADVVGIPDADLLACINTRIGNEPDQPLTREHAQTIRALSCGYSSIADATGLAALDQLEYLDLAGNQLAAIPDLSALTRLQHVYLSGNRLTALPEMSALTQLVYLSVGGNQLTDLPDLSALTELTTLDAAGNQLRALPELSSQVHLTGLYANDNQLTSVPDLSALTQLEYLFLNGNQLETVPELTALTGLRYLYLHGNRLTVAPDVAALTGLWYVDISANHIADVSGLASLEQAFGVAAARQTVSLPDVTVGVEVANPLVGFDGARLTAAQLGAPEAAAVSADDLSWTFTAVGTNEFSFAAATAAGWEFSGTLVQTSTAVPVPQVPDEPEETEVATETEVDAEDPVAAATAPESGGQTRLASTGGDPGLVVGAAAGFILLGIALACARRRPATR